MEEGGKVVYRVLRWSDELRGLLSNRNRLSHKLSISPFSLYYLSFICCHGLARYQRELVIPRQRAKGVASRHKVGMHKVR